MKKFLLKHLGASWLVFASLTVGFCLTWFSDAQSRIATLTGQRTSNLQHEPKLPKRVVAGHSQGNSPSDSADSHSTQFVQEPLTRSAFRPDFSSGLRRANQRNNFTMLRTFSEVVVDARLSTVRLINSVGDSIAMGAIVDSDGWIATKASQLPAGGTVIAKLADNSEAAAEIVQRVTDVDIALLRINRNGLPAVQWAEPRIPSRGTWLATTDVDKMPSAVGVVSAGTQTVRTARPVLGVELLDSADGAMVKRVVPGTGAELAGLKRADNISAVNGTPVFSHTAFQQAIRPFRGGENVTLAVTRGERQFEVTAQLMDLAEELLDETEMEVNGPVSARATGFNRVFTHDTVLEPNQCGGPLCNLDGQVVGLNIARAGRVSSYALPVDVVRPLLESMIAQAKLVSHPVNPAPATDVR